MSFAVNACTIGMVVAGLAMAVVGRRIDRRIGILLSLVLLSIPTPLSTMPARCGIPVFTALRILQGLCMDRVYADPGLCCRDQRAERGNVEVFARLRQRRQHTDLQAPIGRHCKLVGLAFGTSRCSLP